MGQCFSSHFLNGSDHKCHQVPPSDRTPAIELKTVKDSNGVVLVFRDNGFGIDPEHHGSKIFELHRTFHGNQDARGIGLFIIKNQIESMGGSISVENT